LREFGRLSGFNFQEENDSGTLHHIVLDHRLWWLRRRGADGFRDRDKRWCWPAPSPKCHARKGLLVDDHHVDARIR
jgi:hypothetical protein